MKQGPDEDVLACLAGAETLRLGLSRYNVTWTEREANRHIARHLNESYRAARNHLIIAPELSRKNLFLFVCCGVNKTILFRLSRLLSSEEGYHASESSVIRLSRRPWLSHQQRLSHLQSYHALIIQSSTTSGYYTRRHTFSFRCPGAVVFVFIFVVFLDPRAQSTNLHNIVDPASPTT